MHRNDSNHISKHVSLAFWTPSDFMWLTSALSDQTLLYIASASAKKNTTRPRRKLPVSQWLFWLQNYNWGWELDLLGTNINPGNLKMETPHALNLWMRGKGRQAADCDTNTPSVLEDTWKQWQMVLSSRGCKKPNLTPLELNPFLNGQTV